MPSLDDVIHQAARLGLVSRPQLLGLGLTLDDIRGRVERGALRRVHPGVYATFGTPLPYEARVLAGCLAVGPSAVASHRSALAIWDLHDDADAIDITAPRSSHPVPRGIVLHRPLDLRPQDVVLRRHVPVTNPLRTLLDAGGAIPRNQIGECVERALHSHLVTVKGLRVILAELGRRGRTGTGALRWYLDRRALQDRRPESLMEPVMARLLYADLGIGPVEYQPTMRLDGQTIRPDFLISRAQAVVEYDGLDAHASREALDQDLARQNLLVRHGFAVLRYTATHLRRPAQVSREIVAVCLARIAELERLGAA